jgi:hypothetical protein
MKPINLCAAGTRPWPHPGRHELRGVGRGGPPRYLADEGAPFVCVDQKRRDVARFVVLLPASHRVSTVPDRIGAGRAGSRRGVAGLPEGGVGAARRGTRHSTSSCARSLYRCGTRPHDFPLPFPTLTYLFILPCFISSSPARNGGEKRKENRVERRGRNYRVPVCRLPLLEGESGCDDE